MANIFRGEQWEFGFAPETIFGSLTAPAYTYVNQVPGIFEAGTMPDPTYDWKPFYGYGDASLRNFYRMYKGRVALAGSIGDIQLLNGVPMRFAIGKCFSYDSEIDAANVPDTTLNGALSAGALSVTVAAIGAIIDGDYVQIGNYTVDGNDAEIRRVSGAPVGNVFSVDYPLSYAHATGQDVYELQAPTASNPYTHDIRQTIELPSLTWLATYIGTDYDASSKATFLVRRFIGGKVNRCTYAATEGEPLRMSWDDVIFRDWRHNQQTYDQAPAAGDTTSTNKYDSNAAKVTPDYPETEPFYFSYGVCTYFGYVFARVKSFRLEIVNNLEPKYYIASSSSAGQILYEIREGRREYRIATTVDLGDEAVATKTDILKELDIQGQYTVAASPVYRGFNMSLVFTRGTGDTITFALPPATAAAGGDAQGCFLKSAPHNIVTEPQIPVDLDIIARSASITCVDSEYLYP